MADDDDNQSRGWTRMGLVFFFGALVTPLTVTALVRFLTKSTVVVAEKSTPVQDVDDVTIPYRPDASCFTPHDDLTVTYRGECLPSREV